MRPVSQLTVASAGPCFAVFAILFAGGALYVFALALRPDHQRGSWDSGARLSRFGAVSWGLCLASWGTMCVLDNWSPPLGPWAGWVCRISILGSFVLVGVAGWHDTRRHRRGSSRGPR